MKKTKRLGRQIAVRTTIPLALILAALTVFIMLSIMGVLKNLKLREINSQTTAALQVVEGYFEPYYTVNRFLSESSLIKEVMKDGMKKGTSFRYERDSRCQELLDLLSTQHTALGDSIQSVWICGFGNKEMMTSTEWYSEPGLQPESRPWYQELIESDADVTVSSAYVDLECNEVVVSVMRGVYDNGHLIGVVAVDVFLDGMLTALDSVSIGDAGGIIVCDSVGSIVYSRNRDQMMLNVANHPYSEEMKIALAKEGNTLASQKYVEEDNEYYGAVLFSDELNWRLIGTMPNKEFMQEAWSIGIPLFWVIILSIIGTYAICALTGKSLANPARILSDVAAKLAAGELDTEVSVKSNNEIGALAQNISALVEKLKTYILYIDEAAKVLSQMGEGDLRISLEQDYAGEFAQLKVAILSVHDSLVGAITQINDAASQVDNGTSQISGAAQSLAQGTTKQASEIEELAATVTSLSTKSTEGAEVAKELKSSFDGINRSVDMSNQEMTELLNAMADISDKSDKIGKIVKTISDIAFQTNILALNAAVEAARAGQAGKGFSVVADEVRSLASKCDEAANDVTVLVDDSGSAVRLGAELAEKTAATLRAVSGTVGEASKAMDDLADRYKEEASTLTQIANGVEQIAVVVQTNSATAEQTAAGGEELAAQAKMLYALTERFKT